MRRAQRWSQAARGTTRCPLAADEEPQAACPPKEAVREGPSGSLPHPIIEPDRHSRLPRLFNLGAFSSEDIPACRLSEHGSFHRLCRRLLSTVVQPFSPGGSSAEPVQSRDSSWDKSFQLAFLIRNAHIASGRLARDVSLANRVRSGRKQP